jgi:hypothetical protein
MVMTSIFRRFRRDDHASISVELVLVTPIMLWAILAGVVYFDAYRVQGQNIRAGLTIADMVSRERAPVNETFINGTNMLLRSLIDHDPTPFLRITLYDYDAESDTHQVIWSRVRGQGEELVTTDLIALAPRLPLMADDGRDLLVETAVDYVAPFNIGLGPFASTQLAPVTLTTFNVVTPRFIPSICFDTNPTDPNSIPLC